MTDIRITTFKDPIKPTVEAIKDLQRNIDYWAERCIKAEHEIERLRAEVALWEERTKQGAEIIMENVAEIERLQAQVIEAEKYNGWHQQAMSEIERLRAEKIEQEQEWAAVCAERERPLRAEIETLQWQVKTMLGERFAHLAEIKQLHDRITNLHHHSHRQRTKIKKLEQGETV